MESKSLATTPVAQLSADEVRAIEWDCTQVLIRFFNYFDQWRYREMADVFVPDGVWHRQGKALRGRTEILAALDARSTTRRVRHVVTNVQIDVLAADAATSLLYLTAYMHDTGAKLAGPPRIRAPYLFLVVPGRLVRAGVGWKISSMEMNREFEFER
jgi:hypothetical protein